MKRNVFIALAMVTLVGTLAIASCAMDGAADEGALRADAPMFEVDPFWPKPLPNHWVLGSAVGVGIDSQDNVYIIHRQAPLNERT